jgi:hypothetical protein
MELGFQSWQEDSVGEGVIARVGEFKTFELVPDIWTPERVCAVREIGQMAEQALPEYLAFVDTLEAEPVLGV